MSGRSECVVGGEVEWTGLPEHLVLFYRSGFQKILIKKGDVVKQKFKDHDCG